jgi:hypothetical protein
MVALGRGGSAEEGCTGGEATTAEPNGFIGVKFAKRGKRIT